MKIAIVHDQLQEFGGAERVLVALKKIYPEADVYTSFYNPTKLGIHADETKGWNIITSWADKTLFKRFYSPLRFITPLLWEPFNFNTYDLVISSSGSYMSKGIITKPGTVHICYLHHPPRSLYYYETAIEWQKHLPIKIYGNIINHKLRLFDYLSSKRVDYFIANSEETKHRIEKFYRRDADIIYPPVDIAPKADSYESNGGYYLTVSRLARAKHIEILINAANKEKFSLKIVGGGRDEQYLRSLAGSTVEFLGNISDEKLTDVYKHAKAYLFASVDEEFGIAPVEAMGYGLPVIAYASGGLKETIHEGKNGYLYNDLTSESLAQKVKSLESLSHDEYIAMRHSARAESEKYSFEQFKEKIQQFVEQKLHQK